MLRPIRWSALVVLALVFLMAAAGCRQNAYWDAHLELLQAERRALEDRVTDLEIDLQDAHRRLARQSGETTPRERSGSSAAEELSPPSIVIPDGQEGETPPTRPPQIEEGVPFTPDVELPPPRGAAARPATPREELSLNNTPALALATRDPRVTHLHLDRSLTGGADFDRRPGDDGLVVVLQPRNADQQFVPLAGPVTVVALDYAKREQGAAAYVGRWDLDAGTVDQALRAGPEQRGIHLRLPWPDQPPENPKLRVDVRYVTADGRKLDARQDVVLTLPGQSLGRWTPRPNRDAGGLSSGQPAAELASDPRVATPPAVASPTSPLPTDVIPAAGTTNPHTARPQWQPYR